MELQQLLEECRQQSLTAQKWLFDKLSMQMFVVCRRYMRTNETAEEAMMNGFLKVYQQLQKFDYKDNPAFISWAKRIMINECLQMLRKKNSFLQVEESLAAEVAVDEEALERLSANEIFRLITQLPLGYRTVFNLFVIDDLNHKEIAERLGISEGTSKSQLSKAKQLLQQLLIQQNADYAARKAQ